MIDTGLSVTWRCYGDSLGGAAGHTSVESSYGGQIAVESNCRLPGTKKALQGVTGAILLTVIRYKQTPRFSVTVVHLIERFH